ncbi:MAG: hypothetical protein FD123_4201 [Bacteroidetes bacterium]|nr:MAG: hypothetical protein FD123_4201 [Bacteroidota bacterium]
MRVARFSICALSSLQLAVCSWQLFKREQADFDDIPVIPKLQTVNCKLQTEAKLIPTITGLPGNNLSGGILNIL